MEMEKWRVACVRIPRFPIGAVQRARLRAAGDVEERGNVQLLLPMERTEECCSTAKEKGDRRWEIGNGPISPTRCAGTRPSPISHWDEQPIVLTDGATTRPKLRAVSAAAAREGVRAGMSLSEARALCATLEVHHWDDVAIGDAIAQATASFVGSSPQVSPVNGAPGMWWVGASGFAPGTLTEQTLSRALLANARQWHPRARVAIADTCMAARAATWAGASFARTADARSLITIIPHGGDAEYVANAPLSLLPIDAEIRAALRALGIRTIGAFADLDAGDVEQRWGDDGLVAWRLACGDDPRRPVLARMDQPPHVEMELATPAATMEPVLFLVRPGIERLVQDLVSQARAIASLSVTLTLDDARGALPNARAHTITREIRLPRPLARPAPLFERCRGLLSRWTLTAPVTAVRLTVLLTSPLTGEQGDLMDTSWRDPGAADAALERVRAELGPDVVVKPHARDGYVPERSGAWHEEGERRWEIGDRRSVLPISHLPSPISAVRLLDRPEQIEIDREPGTHDPQRIYWRGRALTVTQAIGPERLSGDWWNDEYRRDYWRCESDEEHGELVVYRDDAGWWVQGWYD